MIYSSGGGAAEAKDLGALAALNQALAKLGGGSFLLSNATG